jgi:hypothetical protein
VTDGARVGLAAVMAGVAASVLGGCSSYAGSTLGEQVASWASTTDIRAQVATVRADAQRVGADEAHHDPAAVRTDCVVLSDDTRGAHQLLPSPDAGLSASLDAALGTEQSAAADCYRAASGGTLLARSDGERSRADAALAAALAQLVTLTAGLPAGSR